VSGEDARAALVVASMSRMITRVSKLLFIVQVSFGEIVFCCGENSHISECIAPVYGTHEMAVWIFRFGGNL
jgi:hypothetical protein